jgi:hypothetical protein
MRSNLQQSNGLDAFFKSKRQHLSENAIETFLKRAFDYRIGQMGTANHKNNEFVKWITRTNEAAWWIVLSPNSAQKPALFGFASPIQSRKYMN